MSGPSDVRAVVTITHPTGLHARPAVKFTKLAKTFTGANIKIREGHAGPAGDNHLTEDAGSWIDAKSIVKVMALKLRSGATLEMEATGEQATAAIAALTVLVVSDFDEGVGA